ncbi:MAG: endolytic transglycosylase MltG, partial [Candidatus Eisenbacteria bacterium]
TLASIVEAEAQVDAERPRIARVYLNRLAMGMRLQADPTVGYALGAGPRRRISLRQLRTASPFNTYLYEGLPPGPICNPGRASIAAVIDPLPGARDLFFVADGRGRHLFSETYAQHLANIRLVRSRGEDASADTAAAVARADTVAAAAKRPAAGAQPAPAKPGGARRS